MFLAVLATALMMMTSSSSQAETAQPLDPKIITFTVGDYQEFQAATTTSDQGDHDMNDGTLDLSAVKTDWTAQQAQDFRNYKNEESADYSYDFLIQEELQDALDKEKITDSSSPQWIVSEHGGDLLLFDSSTYSILSQDADHVGALSLRQNSKTPPASSRNDGDASSAGHTDQPDDASSTTPPSHTTPATGTSNTWFTTRNMLIAGAVTLLVVGGIAFFAFGGAEALGWAASTEATELGGSSATVDSENELLNPYL